MIARLDFESCLGVIIDVQEYFLNSQTTHQRDRIVHATTQFIALLGYLQIPELFTVERPVTVKGGVPGQIMRMAEVSGSYTKMEKDFFDLTKEKSIVAHIQSLGRKQILVAGCETDVCVLQSVLGLLSLGYEVFVVEDLLFSADAVTGSALVRMRDSGAVILTLKTLFHELLSAVRGSEHRLQLEEKFGPLPEILKEF